MVIQIFEGFLIRMAELSLCTIPPKKVFKVYLALMILWTLCYVQCTIEHGPLDNYQHHTVILLHSYLCFERVGRAICDPERIIISLKLVKDVVKAKPFAVLPGSGMSIEVTLERGDKVWTPTFTENFKQQLSTIEFVCWEGGCY